MVIIPSFLLSAQEAPHVTQLRAEARNNLIRLTWVDSPVGRGPVHIFRSTRPFSGSVPPNIRPVVVNYGEEWFIDDADDLDNLFYFVAASDVSGQVFDIIVPRANIINVNLSSGNFTGSSAEQAAAEPVPPVRVSIVQGISNLYARQDGDRVIITFNTADPNRNAILYRSMQPVVQPHDLLNAVIVQTRVSSPFIDYPVPGLPWYYAVIYEEEISGGSMRIRSGFNSTVSSVLIPFDDEVEHSLRPIPLPIMTLRNPRQDGFFLNPIPEAGAEMSLSEQSVNMLRALQMPLKTPPPMKEPRVFTVDMEVPPGGDELALYQIIKDYFQENNWEGTRDNLRHFLSLPRSANIEIRARFYLAQSLYFLGDYREALLEFLYVRSHHDEEASAWINAVLEVMVH